MKYLTFATRQEAESYVSSVQSTQKYPIKGTNVGAGKHSTESESLTTSFSLILSKQSESIVPIPESFIPFLDSNTQKTLTTKPLSEALTEYQISKIEAVLDPIEGILETKPSDTESLKI